MRIQRIDYRGFLLTEDTIQAVTALILQAANKGWKVDVVGPSPDDGNPMSLASAGREVHLRLDHDTESVTPQHALNALWGYAVPLRFTPWLRWPVSGPGDMVFYYLGPWHLVNERLLAEGRGHLAWPSVCAAAQVDVGTWKGDREQIRMVQAQLHRIGYNPGPVDGLLSPQTLAALEAAGLKNKPLGVALDCLLPMPNAIPEVSGGGKRAFGTLSIPGQRISVSSFGGIKASQNPQGALITVDGPGRLVVDVGS